MKKYIMISVLSMMIGMTSCLKSGLDELPAFEDADITGVFFEYRYVFTRTDGGQEVKFQTLTTSSSDINKENTTANVTVTVPGSSDTFNESERGKVSQNSLIARFNLSSAAKIEPLDGAPNLGQPGDFNAPVKYKVTAADGKNSKTWTVTVVLVK
jgi:hypothetical protein